MPSILMITSGYPPARTAGLEQGCLRLSTALSGRGWRVTVLTLTAEGLPSDSTDKTGVRVLRVIDPLTVGPLWGISYGHQVGRWMRVLRNEWDVVLTHQLYLHSGVAGRVAARLGKASATLLVAAQAYSDVGRLKSMKAGRHILRYCLANDAYFVLSDMSRRELMAEGVADERIRPYRYFVDIDRFVPSASQTPFTFTFVGRLHHQKNLPLLLDAFDDVTGKHVDARLRIVGDGPDAEAIRRRAAASRCPDRIEFVSWTDNPVPFYQAASAVVTASIAEGLSNVLLEAMACGAPVVTTDVSGAREALNIPAVGASMTSGTVMQGEGGLLVPIGDRAALAEAMTRLAQDASLARMLGNAARRRVVGGFSEGVVVDQFIADATELMAQASATKLRTSRQAAQCHHADHDRDSRSPDRRDQGASNRERRD